MILLDKINYKQLTICHNSDIFEILLKHVENYTIINRYAMNSHFNECNFVKIIIPYLKKNTLNSCANKILNSENLDNIKAVYPHVKNLKLISKAIVISIMLKNIDVVKYLITLVTSEYLEQPLIKAIQYNNMKILKLLYPLSSNNSYEKLIRVAKNSYPKEPLTYLEDNKNNEKIKI